MTLIYFPFLRSEYTQESLSMDLKNPLAADPFK